MTFAGKSIVITGASSGIGEALAVELGGRGARLTLGARRIDELEHVAHACEKAGGEAHPVRTDVTDSAQCEALIEAAVGGFGGIDILINNAGMSMWARFEDITDLSIFERLIQVNYLGAVYCTHHALPHLKQSGGTIVAMSSLTGRTGVPTRSGYAAAKHAVQGFFDSLRIELQGGEVNVLVVSPGFVATNTRAKSLDAGGKPHGRSPRDETRNTMPVDYVVRETLDGIENGLRDLLLPRRVRMGMLIKVIAPRLIDRIAARAVRERL